MDGLLFYTEKEIKDKIEDEVMGDDTKKTAVFFTKIFISGFLATVSFVLFIIEFFFSFTYFSYIFSSVNIYIYFITFILSGLCLYRLNLQSKSSRESSYKLTLILDDGIIKDNEKVKYLSDLLKTNIDPSLSVYLKVLLNKSYITLDEYNSVFSYVTHKLNLLYKKNQLQN